jgi:dihydroorotase
MANPDTLELTRPDDWHLHLRDGAALRAVLPDSVRRFARAIVMPNLQPPVRTVVDAQAYRERILAAVPAGASFRPLMTLYLTEQTSAADVRAARDCGFVHAVKYYPAGATTNSQSGVTDLARCDAVFEAMQEIGLPLLVHGEVTDPAVDVFDREAVFIERHGRRLVERFPALKLVMEHLTTREGADFVRESRAGVAGTITPQHLLWNRNAIFRGGLRPHAFCLPVLKREAHRLALVAAATSGNPKYFLGTDSAPHARGAKESDCGCAGVYSAHAAIELYAEAFDLAGALDRLEGFASFPGPDFYGLPRNTDRIVLKRESWTVAAAQPFGDTELVPMRAGETVSWRLA